MAKFNVKRESDVAKIPDYHDGIFTFYSEQGSNIGLQPGHSMRVDTGVSVTIPAGSIGIVALVPDFIGPDTNIIISEGVNFLFPGRKQTISVKVTNTGDTVRIIRSGEPLCNLVIVPITEYVGKGKEDSGSN